MEIIETCAKFKKLKKVEETFKMNEILEILVFTKKIV
jgi:hypothetical protein